MANPTVRWNGENLADVQRLLQSHEAVAAKHGDILLITGEGLGITLELGDELILSGEQLGVRRPVSKAPDPYITWDGNNIFEMSRFVSGWKVRCELKGNTLYIHDLRGRDKPARLEPGDRLIDRKGMPVVSKAGRDHLLQ